MRKCLFIIVTMLFSASVYAQQNTAVNNTLKEIFAQGSDRSCCNFEFKDDVCNINLFNGWQLAADVKVATVGRSSEHGSDNSFVQAPTSPEEDFIDLGPKLGVMPKDVEIGKHKNYLLHDLGHSPISFEFKGVDLGVVGY